MAASDGRWSVGLVASLGVVATGAAFMLYRSRRADEVAAAVDGDAVTSREEGKEEEQEDVVGAPEGVKVLSSGPVAARVAMSPPRVARRHASVSSYSSAVSGEVPLDEGEQAKLQKQLPLYKIVLTGGPCAGKTTALARLSEFLRARGFRVYTVPEAATMLFSNGATFVDLGTDEKQMHFQSNLIKTQFHLEDTFASLAADCGQPAVLLCDRGSMDGAAYISRETWLNLLAHNDLDEMTIRDTRYNAVVHLVTAAQGAEKFYTSATNETRLENAEEARALDRKTLTCWTGHPRVLVIGNEGTGFEDKLTRVVDGVAHLVGLPATKRGARKYLLTSMPSIPADVRVEEFDVEKVYVDVLPSSSGLGRQISGLEAPGAEAPAAGADEVAPAGAAVSAKHPEDREAESSSTRYDPGSYPYAFVRRRRQPDGRSSYGLTTATLGADGKKLETKRIISKREYAHYVQRADPTRRVVRQRRTSFLWRDRFFEIDSYIRPHKGLCLLRCQISSERDDPRTEFPDWLAVELDVTHDSSYSAYRLSLRDDGGTLTE